MFCSENNEILTKDWYIFFWVGYVLSFVPSGTAFGHSMKHLIPLINTTILLIEVYSTQEINVNLYAAAAFLLFAYGGGYLFHNIVPVTSGTCIHWIETLQTAITGIVGLITIDYIEDSGLRFIYFLWAILFPLSTCQMHGIITGSATTNGDNLNPKCGSRTILSFPWMISFGLYYVHGNKKYETIFLVVTLLYFFLYSLTIYMKNNYLIYGLLAILVNNDIESTLDDHIVDGEFRTNYTIGSLNSMALFYRHLRQSWTMTIKGDEVIEIYKWRFCAEKQRKGKIIQHPEGVCMIQFDDQIFHIKRCSVLEMEYFYKLYDPKNNVYMVLFSKELFSYFDDGNDSVTSLPKRKTLRDRFI